MNDFAAMRYPVANKDHTCDHCHCAIRKGERYIRRSGRCDGYMFTLKSHEDCSILWQTMWVDFGALSYESMPFDLLEAAGGFDELVKYRDDFPAVISRIEERMKRDDEPA